MCPPGYLVQHCSCPEGRGGGVTLVYRVSISLTGLPVPSRSGLECLYLVLGDRDRLGILLVYRAPFCPTVSLPELTETVSDLVLRTPSMLVLGDFNLHAETGLTGAAQDFMASMTAMGLSQHVTGPNHERGHTLDLVFSTGQEEGGLRVRNLCLTPLSWSDHFLVRFVLESDLSLCKSAGPIVWVHPQSWMDPDGFLKALGEFPADKTGVPVEALVELWNREMTRAVDTIAPKRPLPPGRAHSSPWYTPELRVMKQAGRWLEHRWRRSRDESDRTHLRAHYRAYAVVVRVAKKSFFSISIASSKCHPAELFRVVQGLVRPGPKKDLVSPSKARCDNFAMHFREKIAQIRHELDTGFGEGELNLVLNGVALPLRDKVHSLGVLLDPELSLEAQVTAVARNTFLQLRLIHQLRPYLEYDCLATMTHALVTSRLDFCNVLCVGLPLKTVWILQLVQNRAARLLTGTGRYVHMTPVLRQLHWLPIQVRAQFKVLVMTYKALNSLGPGYLKERLHPYTPARLPLEICGRGPSPGTLRERN
ncbi:hypothetical protein EYD10_00878 [Varanus komodoensis]|nr:hypothetical protein EYD10_00878 [Varanus komodoensis]